MGTLSNIQSTNVPISGLINIRLFFAMVLLTIAVIFIILVAKNDSTAFLEHTYIYIISILFLVFSIFFYFISQFQPKEKSQAFSFLFIAFLIISTITISVYVMNNLGIFKFFTADLMLNAILLCIILLGLAIFYILFLTKYTIRGSSLSFIINFIFYIPCLFSDFFNYLLKDFITTPKSVFHLLFIEFILILIYFYFYPKMQETSTNNGVVLVGNPIFLNKRTQIDGQLYQTFFNKMNDPISNKVTISSPLRTTYSIGMWIFLNIQPLSQLSYKNELNLFDYKSPDNTSCNCTSHPKVAYMNSKSGVDGTDEYIFYLAPTADNKDSVKYSKSLPHQKWNYLVFNYRDGAVDIFINGVFETSVVIPVPISYTYQDTISVGQYDLAGKDRSGIYGSICNVVYYRNILSKSQIISNYNLLSIKSPPV